MALPRNSSLRPAQETPSVQDHSRAPARAGFSSFGTIWHDCSYIGTACQRHRYRRTASVTPKGGPNNVEIQPVP